jgi:hypothetical protein
MKKTLLVSVVVGLFACSCLNAQVKTGTQPLPLFQSESILDLALVADFRTVFSNTDDSTYFPAWFSFQDNNGVKKEVEIKVRTRGKTRRQGDICRFPPLRLNFPKSDMKNSPFEGQNAIKLVTHCDRADSYEQNTIMEYLIYKAFNVLTDSSFKVRAASMNYIDEKDKADSTRKFAFFIEREKHVAERLQAIEMEDEKIQADHPDPYQTCLVDMFQYMIGNTDYSVYEQHNIVLYTNPTRTAKPIPIPYDFDWSGMVAAAYATPNPKIGTEHVTDRIYRGVKQEEDVVFHTIKRFNDKKDEIYRVFENFELLKSSEKKTVIKYLDDFYWIINNERQVKTEFFDRARIVNEN